MKHLIPRFGGLQLILAITLLAPGLTACRGPLVQSQVAPQHQGSGAVYVRQVLDDLARTEVDDSRLAETLLGLSNNPRLTRVGEVPLEFLLADGARPAYHLHPQGLARDPRTGDFYVTAVEIIRMRGPDGKRNGEGNGYLFRFSSSGQPLGSVLLSNGGAEFHPGGIDISDNKLYLSLSPYRPHSSATIFEVPLGDLTPVPLFSIEGNHIGVAAITPDAKELHLLSWNAAVWFRYTSSGQRIEARTNPTPDRLAHQDIQVLSGSYLLLTGVATGDENQFGLDLVNSKTGKVEKSIRWDSSVHSTAQGWLPLQNPTYTWSDHSGRLFVLAAPNSQVGEFRERPHAAGADVADVAENRPWQGSLLLYEITDRPPLSQTHPSDPHFEDYVRRPRQ